MWAICKRELFSLFVSPFAWVLLALSQLVLAWFFLISIDFYLNGRDSLTAVPGAHGFSALIISELFGKTALLSLLLMPLLSMRSFSEERRQQRLALLLSAPVTPAHIVLGKYLSLFFFSAVLLAMISLMPLFLLFAGALDLGHLAAAMLGLLLLLAAFNAIGVFFSLHTQYPALAAMATFALLLLLWLLDWAGSNEAPLFAYLSSFNHYAPWLRGQFNSQHLGYFILLTGGFLLLSTRRLQAEQGFIHNAWQRWSLWVLILSVSLLLAAVSQRYVWQIDWTQDHRHSLAPRTIQLLEQLKEPLEITVYATEEARLRQRIRTLLELYQQHSAHIEWRFVDPESFPSEARAAGVSRDGEVHIRYQNRQARVMQLHRVAFSQALHRLLREQQRRLSFLTGHGERKPLGKANFDWGYWGTQLQEQGLLLHDLDLTQIIDIPRNIDLLVIAGPRLALAPGEVKAVQDYVNDGGHLLLSLDPSLAPDAWQGLQPLADALGLKLPFGKLIDPNSSRLFGPRNATVVTLSQYPEHPVTTGLGRTVFPETAALQLQAPADWDSLVFLRSADNGWLETDMVNTPAKRDDNEPRQAYAVGVLFERSLDENSSRKQRIAVLGDGDFLSNAYVENNSNLDLGMKLLNWLVADEALIAIPARVARDADLELSPHLRFMLVFGFLFGLPLVLFGTGLWILWHRSRSRMDKA